MVPRAADLIRHARTHLDVIEHPVGSNDGPTLREFLKSTPWQPGEAWCFYAMLAIALETWGSKADLPKSIEFTGSCQAAALNATSLRKLLSAPATGSIFLLHNADGRFHHAGLVTNIFPKFNLIETIEGNTNDDGSCEGYRMMVRARHNINLRFITW